MLVDTSRKCFSNVIMSAVNQKHKLATEKSYEVASSLGDVGGLLSFENAKIGDDLDLRVMKEDIIKSVRVCLVYYFNWLKGVGAVAHENLMEVSSTVEICRIQLWVWLK